MMPVSPSSTATESATMMQIVPVGSHARRAAALARFVGPMVRASASIWLFASNLGQLRRHHGG
jgi:hypothetical protein